jgi:hypothetical protein
LNQLHFFPLPLTDIVKAGMECVNFGGQEAGMRDRDTIELLVGSALIILFGMALVVYQRL